MKSTLIATLAALAVVTSACGGPQPLAEAGAPASRPLGPDAFGVEPRAADAVECTNLDLGEQITHTKHGEQLLADGRVVAFEQVTHGQAGSYESTASFTLDGEPLMTLLSSVSGSSVSVSVSYGDAFSGIRQSHVEVSEGVMTGSIDERELQAVEVGSSSAEWGFSDGEGPPEVAIDPEIAAAIDALMGAEPEECGQAMAGQPGHDSDPMTSIECIGCWAGCVSIAVGCIIGAAAGCAATGPFYALCVAVVLAGCAIAEVACFAGCNSTGGPCCPVGCGEVACCADGETCLDSAAGLCCSPGLDPCVGQSCCTDTEVCIGAGAEAGTCCPATNMCGSTCCGDLETCHDGTCCPFDAAACGGGCCEPGQECLGGEQCCPAPKVCGDQCCGPDEACNQATMQCESICAPEEVLCPSGTCCLSSEMCTDEPGICCQQGEYYCDGECRPVGECIH